MLTFALVQPFGDGPDEAARYKIVQFIEERGTLPRGDDPQVAIEGYGGSYAYQPILTYMIQGFLLRTLSSFGFDFHGKLLISRCICILMGVTAAVYTFFIGRELWKEKFKALLFAIGVIFLPQNLFIFTYINTDSMGLLSVAMIIYSMLRLKRTGMDTATVIQLGLGINCCLLSYYNCYGILVAAAAAYFYYWLGMRDRKAPGYKRELTLKTTLLAVIVIAGSGWWFVRNGILYNGDILALNTRQMAMTAVSSNTLNQGLGQSYAERGIPIGDMIFGTDYFTLVWKSFIGMFGPMQIPTHHYIYETYKYLFWCVLIGGTLTILISLMMPYGKNTGDNKPAADRIYTMILMVPGGIIPVILALYYSYTWDFQPQGRYYLPMLIPFMYLCTVLASRLIEALKGAAAWGLGDRMAKYTEIFLYHLIYAYIGFAAVYSVFYVLLRYYGVFW